MEIRMNEMQLPEKIGFNYKELKQELTEKVSMYETLVYSDDQIKQAKEDKANLNKLKKALNDERIRREKEYMQPFNEFKAQVNEIIGIIDKPIAVIDRQVKEYEEKQKQDKYSEIHTYFITRELPDDMPDLFDKIFDSKWLNASVSMKSIREAIDTKLEQIFMDVKIIEDLPEFAFEAMETYKSCLDVRTALNEANRLAEIARRKAEQERIIAERETYKMEEASTEEVVMEEIEQVPESLEGDDLEPCDNFIPDFGEILEKKWVVIKAKLTADEKAEILQILTSKNVEFELL